LTVQTGSHADSHGEPLHGIAFSPDGGQLAVACSDHSVKVWDTTSWQVQILYGHTDEVMSVSFSPDGRRMVSASNDNTVRIWDANSGMLLRVLRGHDGNLMCAADFSFDGRLIASCSETSIKIWDSALDQRSRNYWAHRLPRPGLGTHSHCQGPIQPDGRRLASASEDHTVRIWRRAPEKWSRC